MKKAIGKILATTVLISATFSVNATVLNSSFEDGLTDWTVVKTGAFGAGASGLWDANKTDGSRAGRMWSHSSCFSACGDKSFSTGDYAGFYQSIDMTHIDSILFDSILNSSNLAYDSFQNFTRAAAYIDNVLVWSATDLGTYIDNIIDTTLLTGLHTLEFRLEAIASGTDYKSDHLYIDNIRVTMTEVSAPATILLLLMGLAGLAISRKHQN